jgi:2-iminobutanoate/2-iminopropanoate deaminase
VTRGIDEPFDVAKVPLAMHYEVDGVVYVSGHIPLDDAGYFVKGDVGPQTSRVLENIERLLRSVGSRKEEIVKVNVFLAHAKRDFDAMNAAYGRFFGEHRPARSTVGVELAVDVLVEIEAIAVRGAAS